MKKADLIIVGGSAAGIEAAITAQRQYPEKSILVIRKEEQALVPCGIPYIMGTLGSAEKDVMPTKLLGNAELVIDEVTAINRKTKSVTTAGGESFDYDRLILATGSRPAVPPIPGANLENVFTIRKEIQYLKQLQDALRNARDVVIVGGGFSGAEFADECRELGLKVVIVVLLERWL